MTTTGFVVLVVVAVIAVAIFLELAQLPGRKARERGHPQAEAINILGWIGLLMGFAPWVGALVWAYTSPGLLAEPAPSAEAEPPVAEETEGRRSP